MIFHDLSFVETWRSLRYPVWREQMILPHDTQNPLASDLVPLDEAESAPDLAMPFTGKRRGVQVVPDEGKQFVIRKKSLWPAFG